MCVHVCVCVCEFMCRWMSLISKYTYLVVALYVYEHTHSYVRQKKTLAAFVILNNFPANS